MVAVSCLCRYVTSLPPIDWQWWFSRQGICQKWTLPDSLVGTTTAERNCHQRHLCNKMHLVWTPHKVGCPIVITLSASLSVITFNICLIFVLRQHFPTWHMYFWLQDLSDGTINFDCMTLTVTFNLLWKTLTLPTVEHFLILSVFVNVLELDSLILWYMSTISRQWAEIA